MDNKRLHLLIVEDEEAHVEAIRRAFDAADAKIDIHVAGTLREYREYIAAHPPDIALVDLNLPDGRAVEVLTSPPEDASFPVLVMTAFGNQQIVVEVMKAGALDYVVKSPEAFATMPHAVERVLREWKLLQKRKRAERMLAEAAENNLKEAQAFTDNMLEVMQDVFYTFDLKGKFIKWNKAFSAITGYSDQEISLMTPTDFFRGQDVKRVMEAVAETFKTGRGVVEADFVAKDGKHIPYEFTGSLLKDHEGNSIGLCGSGRNLTERKLAEETLKKHQEELKAILDSSPAMIFYKDKENRFVRVNAALAKATGLSKEEMEGKTCWDFYPRELADHYWQDDKEVIAAGKPKLNIVESMETPSGTIWVQSDKIPCRGPNGEVIGIIGFTIDTTERKRAEAALQESEKKYRTIIEGSHDAIMTLAPPSWKFTSANPATIEMFKVKNVDEFVSCEPWRLSPERQPDGRASNEKAKEMIEKAMREGFNFFEWTHKRLNGEEFPVTVLLSRIELNTNVLLQATVRDISELKRAEKAQQEAIEEQLKERNLLELVLKTAQDGYWLVDASTGRLIDTNEAASSMIGYTREELLARGLKDIDAQWSQEEIGREMQKIKTAGHGFFETRHRVKGGQIIDVEISVNYLPATNQFTSFIRNITERKLAEIELAKYRDHLETLVKEQTAAIKASSAQFKTIFEDSRDGILLADIKSQKFFMGNKTICNMLGYTEEEIKNIKINDIHPEKNLPQVIEVFGKQARGEIKLAENLPVKRKDGSVFYADINTSLINLSGKIYLLGSFRDITQRKQAEETIRMRSAELARSNKELEQFAAVASHDLQEPLRMITSFMQLLSRRYKGKLDAEADEFIGYAADGAKRLHMMINDLLNYSRLNKQPKPFELFDCDQALKLALAYLQVVIRETGAVITHDSLPAIMADQTQLVALFQNLVGNAIKFRGEAAPRIHISAKLQPIESSTPQSAIANPQSDEWVFAIKDNGIGIEPQYFSRVFDIFQRLHPVGKYPGTGIGLATCKKVVERHGGRIWIESQPGQGSTFYFTISATKQEAKDGE